MEREEQHITFHEGPVAASCITELVAACRSKTNLGAFGLFLGQVRADQSVNGTVTSIHYTAYEEMAMEKMKEIHTMIHAKYPLDHFRVYHSLGSVAAGELCFCVFTASAHRRAALEACDELVELVKNELPIWGKEYLAGAGHQWKVNRAQ